MTHAEHAEQKQGVYETLRDKALVLTKQVANLDTEIKTLSDTRAAVQKELRGVKSKMVTLELAKSLVA